MREFGTGSGETLPSPNGRKEARTNAAAHRRGARSDGLRSKPCCACLCAVTRGRNPQEPDRAPGSGQGSIRAGSRSIIRAIIGRTTCPRSPATPYRCAESARAMIFVARGAADERLRGRRHRNGAVDRGAVLEDEAASERCDILMAWSCTAHPIAARSGCASWVEFESSVCVIGEMPHFPSKELELKAWVEERRTGTGLGRASEPGTRHPSERDRNAPGDGSFCSNTVTSRKS